MNAVLAQEAHVVAQQRAAAERALSSTEHQQARGRAALDVFAWVAGEGPAPLSGEGLVADAEGLWRERARALDAQERLGYRGDEAVRAGVVALVLGWLTAPGYPETPFYN